MLVEKADRYSTTCCWSQEHKVNNVWIEGDEDIFNRGCLKVSGDVR